MRIHPAVTLAIACAATVATVGAALWSWRDSLRPLATRNITLDTELLPQLARWSRAPRLRNVAKIALFSDSLAICGEESYLPPRLHDDLARRGIASNLLGIVHPGLRPSSFYFLLAPVAAGRPTVAVVEVNPRAFAHVDPGPVPRLVAGHEAYGFRNLSRFVPWDMVARRPAAFAAEGVGPFDPLIHSLAARLDLLHVVEGLRIAVDERMLDLDHRATTPWQPPNGFAAPGWVRMRSDLDPRAAAERSAEAYAAAFADEPAAAILREIREELLRRRVGVLFYVPPLNLEGLREELGPPGARAGAGLSGRLDALRRAVGASPAEWLDLHQAGSRRVFRDNASHLEPAGCAIVGQRLAIRLAARLGRRAGTAERTTTGGMFVPPAAPGPAGQNWK